MLRDLYWNIRNFFFPNYRWLTSKLGRAFIDKDLVILITLYESLIDFWERDDGEVRMRENALHEEVPELKAKAELAFQECRAAYRWAKVDRDAKVLQIAEATASFADRFVNETEYGGAVTEQQQILQEEIVRMQNELDKLDDTYLGLILHNRQALWS